MIIFFHKVALYNEVNDETIIFGQYQHKIRNIHIEGDYIYEMVCCKDRPDFFIKIQGKVSSLCSILFDLENDATYSLVNIEILYPFVNNQLLLHKNTSAIISTLCKDYSHRLDEWIQYHLKLGFSGIIIFNNEANQTNGLNESIEYCNNKQSMPDICNKYKDKVILVDYPYSPFSGEHWNSIQRISLNIGVFEFRNKCKYISLTDSDEFIFLPNKMGVSIETFLENYHTTITMKSNILTNKNMDDNIDNNVLDICRYVGEEMYTKIMLFTDSLSENEFILTPHDYNHSECIEKDRLIHYHVWVNKRYQYNDRMEKIDDLYNFYNI
jgi:hypothetical protein